VAATFSTKFSDGNALPHPSGVNYDVPLSQL